MTRAARPWKTWTFLMVAWAATTAAFGQSPPSVVAPAAKLTNVDDRFQFTEGPASDARGSVYFSDVRASLTYRWSPAGEIAVWRKDTGGANGLAFDRAGNLLACEGGRGRVVTIDPQQRVTVLADQYRGRPFNQPNDLWIAPNGGVYFSDPIYGRAEKKQDGEHVYYVAPDRKQVLRVIDDMVRPNGLVGTPDGKTLYVTDHGAKRTYAYAIEPDGTLSHRRLFASVGADGMKLDAEGNLYLAERGILVYDPTGKRRESIEVPQQPTNLCFAGPDGRTLFITARLAVYTLRMRVAGADFPPRQRQSRATTRPNFVFILGEGHGWASTSVQMDDAVPQSKSAFVRTPNLERLARAGMRFANFYAPSPRCTPSRAAYLTGTSPARLRMTFVGEGKGDPGDADAGGKIVPPRCLLELPDEATTVAELLQRAGYATAHFGKWHLGRINPVRHGFDESDGATGNGGPNNVADPHPKELYGMTEQSMDFMARQVRAGKPFYLQLSHYASRKGGDASPEATAAVKGWGEDLNERQRAEAAADFDLDFALEKLLKRIEDLGIAGNTYVVFTTDHGSPGRNRPLTGGKGTVWEGGLRVPLVVRGPGIKAGVCCHVRAVGVDLLPTIAALAGVTEPLARTVEGGSLVPLLQNEGQGLVPRLREEYVVHFPHYDKDEIGPASTILMGNLKLVRSYETGTLQLFDIAKDPAERHDLAAEMPEKAKQLDRRLSEYLAAVKAQMPARRNEKERRPAR